MCSVVEKVSVSRVVLLRRSVCQVYCCLQGQCVMYSVVCKVSVSCRGGSGGFRNPLGNFQHQVS